jgi:hypothetical protein
MAKELDLKGAFRWGIEFDWAVRLHFVAPRRRQTAAASGRFPLEEAVKRISAGEGQDQSTRSGRRRVSTFYP